MMMMKGVMKLPPLFNSSPLTGCATAWRIAGDDAREAQTAEIQAELVVIILAHQFSVHFRNAVNSTRSLDLRIFIRE